MAAVETRSLFHPDRAQTASKVWNRLSRPFRWTNDRSATTAAECLLRTITVSAIAAALAQSGYAVADVRCAALEPFNEEVDAGMLLYRVVDEEEVQDIASISTPRLKPAGSLGKEFKPDVHNAKAMKSCCTTTHCLPSSN